MKSAASISTTLGGAALSVHAKVAQSTCVVKSRFVADALKINALVTYANCSDLAYCKAEENWFTMLSVAAKTVTVKKKPTKES